MKTFKMFFVIIAMAVFTSGNAQNSMVSVNLQNTDDPNAANMTAEQRAQMLDGQKPAGLVYYSFMNTNDFAIAREIAIMLDSIQFNEINQKTNGAIYKNSNTGVPLTITRKELPTVWRTLSSKGMITLEFETDGERDYVGAKIDANGHLTGEVGSIKRKPYKNTAGQITEKSFRIKAAGQVFAGPSALCGNNKPNLYEYQSVPVTNQQNNSGNNPIKLDPALQAIVDSASKRGAQVNVNVFAPTVYGGQGGSATISGGGSVPVYTTSTDPDPNQYNPNVLRTIHSGQGYSPNPNATRLDGNTYLGDRGNYYSGNYSQASADYAELNAQQNNTLIRQNNTEIAQNLEMIRLQKQSNIIQGFNTFANFVDAGASVTSLAFAIKDRINNGKMNVGGGNLTTTTTNTGNGNLWSGVQ